MKKQKNLDQESDAKKLWRIFQKKKKVIFFLFFLNIFIVFLSLAVVGLRFLYPYHLILGLGLYVFSYIPLLYRLYFSRKTFRKFQTYAFAKDFFGNKKRKILFTLITAVFIVSFFSVRPFGKGPFSGMPPDEISSAVDRDLEQAALAADYLEVSGWELIEDIKINSQDTLASDEKVREDFHRFLQAVVFSEYLTERHIYFDSIPSSVSGNAREKSFIIAYSLYIQKYAMLQRIIAAVSGEEHKKKILNEYNELLGREDLYREMAFRYYQPKTWLRIHLGRAYLKFLYEHREGVHGENYHILHKNARESYAYLLENFDVSLAKTFEVGGEHIEGKMFSAWFPIQKGVANAMGEIVFFDRKEKGFITREQIAKMRLFLRPGDILLQRRNWHLSNAGIPGFWTHSAIYTGSLKDMESFFSDLFPFEGYAKFSDLLRGKFPSILDRYSLADEEGVTPSVIESIADGVIAQSLEKSANADFVVAFRVNIPKKDLLLSLLRAFENFGKPYDYDFDFAKRDAFVCSELIYDAYSPIEGKKDGVHFVLSSLNGRRMISPIDIALKFSEERGASRRELNFIYFLKGSETEKRAYPASEEAFLETIYWSKFSFFQE